MYGEGDETVGLILTGGGARGAYQVGVLKAIAELAEAKQVPFPVISGVSVGALNAVGLASKFSDFMSSVDCLESFWRALRTENVFEVRFRKIAFTGLRMFLSEFMPFIFRSAPNSLLDTEPLRNCLSRSMDLESMSQSIAAKELRAVSVTCSGYSSGHAVTFFQSASKVDDWHRVRRDGIQRKLTIDHIMASAALPFLFPAVKIDDEYFGDGALRLTSPLAPAIHLNATRLLIIGTRDNLSATESFKEDNPQHPTIGDLIGYAMDTLFHDSLDADIERLERVNKTLKRIPAKERAGLSMAQIDTLTIHPSQDLQKIALDYVHQMPRALRWALRRKKAAQNNGRLESYLLFEPGYVGSLIDLGYKDAKAKATEIRSFLNSKIIVEELAA
jgi:NTE family protein